MVGFVGNYICCQRQGYMKRYPSFFIQLIGLVRN
jgi:hypothetical protein